MATEVYENLVQLLQGGKIGFNRFMLEGDQKEDYLKWCEEHNIEPNDDAAEFYYDQTEIDMMAHQDIDNEENGIWL